MSVPDLSATSVSDLISLRGRTAVVTGGKQGLGSAIARRLAQAGASVVIGDLREQPASETAQRLAEESGSSVVAMQMDVTDPDSVKRVADRASEEFGGLDIWVNNAGIYPDSPILDMPYEEWTSVVNVNLHGSFLGAREAARRMSDAGKNAVILNVSSTAGFKALVPGTAHYVATKHAVRGLTSSMALELAPKGIRVLGIAPTVILTPGVQAKRDAADAGGNVDPEVVRRREASLMSLLGRPGVPDDIARVALFCVSDLAMFMTGSTILVDAGEMTR